LKPRRRRRKKQNRKRDKQKLSVRKNLIELTSSSRRRVFSLSTLRKDRSSSSRAAPRGHSSHSTGRRTSTTCRLMTSHGFRTRPREQHRDASSPSCWRRLPSWKHRSMTTSQETTSTELMIHLDSRVITLMVKVLLGSVPLEQARPISTREEIQEHSRKS